VTFTLLSATAPSLVTMYVQVTVLPTATWGPGAVLASSPLVFLTILMCGYSSLP